MKYSYILVMHYTFKLFKVLILRKNVLVKSFLPIWVFQELLKRVISIKGVSMIYKLLFEYNESHCVFTSVFESIIFILVLCD